MKNVRLLLDKSVSDLAYGIQDNYLIYTDKNKKFEDIFEKQYYFEEKIKIELPTLSLIKDAGKLYPSDAKNAIALHKAFRDKLDINILLDKRFISYLSHFEYKNYLIDRNKLGSDLEVNKKLARIKTNFFLETSPKDYSRNHLFKLIFVGLVAFDKANLENPYHLYLTAFEYVDAINSMIERKVGHSKKVIRALLKAIQKSNETVALKDNKYKWMLPTEINRLAAIKILDLISEKELIEIFIEEIKKVSEKFNSEVK